MEVNHIRYYYTLWLYPIDTNYISLSAIEYIMEEDLLHEYFKSTEKEFKEENYTSSTVLYSKFIFLSIDLYLKRRYNVTVKNHNERKIYLASKKNIDSVARELYDIYENVYKLYIETYTRKIKKEEAIVVKNIAEKIKDIIKYD